jgi:ATP-dependent Lon protease
MEIAKRFLVPKQTEECGLKKEQVEFRPEGLNLIIRDYTREAGVRNLEREIGNVCRKIAREVVTAQSAEKPAAKDSGSAKGKAGGKGEAAKPVKAVIDESRVTKLLGPPKFRDLSTERKNEIGATTGLAWTEVGGQILTTEATVMDGRGKLTTTGKLGDVMQESAQAAMSYIRSRAQLLGIPKDFYRHLDIHIHVPEGAIPKDGPSAGITIATTLCSALTKIPVRGDVAMTGEITLRGRVLPIGGVKEKLLAAHRNGITRVILPKDNEKDLPEVPEYISKDMELHFVESMDEVLKLALEREVEPMPLSPGISSAETTPAHGDDKLMH